MDNDGYISVRQAAALLGRSPRTVRRLARSAGWSTRLDRTPDGRQVRMVPRDAVMARVLASAPPALRDMVSRDVDAASRDNLPTARPDNSPVAMSDTSADDLAGAMRDLASATREASSEARRRDRVQVAIALVMGLPILVGVAILAWRLVAMLEGI